MKIKSVFLILIYIMLLARSGVLFSNAYCVVPACNPSRTALMPVLRPETTRQFTNAGNFRDKSSRTGIVTLAQYGKTGIASGIRMGWKNYMTMIPIHENTPTWPTWRSTMN